MQIALDTTPLETMHLNRGIGWYTKNLIKALRRYEPNNSYTTFTRGEKLSKNVDLVHYPYFDNFFSTLPWRRSLKTVVTIHDLIQIRFMRHFKPGVRGKLAWFKQKIKLKTVQAVIADSEATKKDIISFTSYPAEDIKVVYLAASEDFRLIKDQKFLKNIKKKYDIRGDFILYVGDINYNKNIKRLLLAFNKISKEFSYVQLFLVGEAFLNNIPESEEIDQLIAKLELHNQVRRLGFVPTEELVGLYNLAKVYVQPSLFEGFGLPVVEAMACGCPVVCTQEGALPEVVGENAIYVDAKDSKSIAAGIAKVLNFSQFERQKMVNNLLKQAKKFSWRKTAHDTVRVYKYVLEKVRK